MTKPPLIDHLFRHQYGKMVSILIRIFGLQHLETIEDAVQDTFVKAMLSWRNGLPENPEAWLTKAAKNRVIDLFRKLQAEQKRLPKIENGLSAIAINELFLDTEIEDSQLRMIFTACHPTLSPREQIAFSLKTISGFSSKEIASALLLKEETIKKRLSRARKLIKNKQIAFQIPQGDDLPGRLSRVLEVLYLIFNEGFHSNKKKILIRKDLCGEAMRLCQLVLKNTYTQHSSAYALFALMCFHAARLDSKTNDNNELLDLKSQDRSKWYLPLIKLGHAAMNKATINGDCTSYHYEAAIAAEHLKAKTFEDTDWDKLLLWHERLHELEPSSISLLNICIVQLQRGEYGKAYQILNKIRPEDLEQRAYLYYGSYAEYFALLGDNEKALERIEYAIKLVKNEAERQYLEKKKELLL